MLSYIYHKNLMNHYIRFKEIVSNTKLDLNHPSFMHLVCEFLIICRFLLIYYILLLPNISICVIAYI